MEYTKQYLSMSEKKTLLEVITGSENVPIKIEFTPYSRQTILSTAGVLGIAAIITALIIKSN